MKKFCNVNTLIVVFVICVTFYSCKTRFSVGLVSDCQYCNVEGEGVRKYSKSTDKLKQCIDHYNTLDLK